MANQLPLEPAVDDVVIVTFVNASEYTINGRSSYGGETVRELSYRVDRCASVG